MPLQNATTVAKHAGFTVALSRVWYWSLLVGAYGALTVLVGPREWIQRYDPGAVVDAVLAFILGLVLMFRINRAYERWWEARTLWGKLVNVSRNLAVKVKRLGKPDEAETAHLRSLISGFAYALKDHLRGRAVLRGVPGFERTEDDPKHVPAYLVDQLYLVLAEWRSSGRLSESDLFVVDREARELLEVLGGCERIKNTLMAQSFASLTRQALVFYLLYLPWSLSGEIGYFSVPLVVLISYFVIAAEGIAHYVERPFGQQEDHLDLAAICFSIETSVDEILTR